MSYGKNSRILIREILWRPLGIPDIFGIYQLL